MALSMSFVVTTPSMALPLAAVEYSSEEEEFFIEKVTTESLLTCIGQSIDASKGKIEILENELESLSVYCDSLDVLIPKIEEQLSYCNLEETEKAHVTDTLSQLKVQCTNLKETSAKYTEELFNGRCLYEKIRYQYEAACSQCAAATTIDQLKAVQSEIVEMNALCTNLENDTKTLEANIEAFKTIEQLFEYLTDNVIYRVGLRICINGVYYELISRDKRTVKIVQYGDNIYTGTLDIPSGVFIDDGVLCFVMEIERKILTNHAIIDITVDSENKYFYVKDGVLYSKDGKQILLVCSGKTSLNIPEGVERVNDYAACCSRRLETVSFPQTLKSIGNSAFGGTALTEVYFPGSLTTIGEYSFCDCASLKTISIPASVSSIEQYAFRNCGNLTKIVSRIKNPKSVCGVYPFYYCNSDAILYVPKGTYSSYKNDSDWWHISRNIKEFTDGDINNDGAVDDSDAAEAINCIANVQMEAIADVNDDGLLDVRDIVSMLKLTLGTTQQSASKSINALRAETTEAVELSAETSETVQTGNAELTVYLSNSLSNLTAFQFDISLPEGVSIAEREDGTMDISLTNRFNGESTKIVATKTVTGYRLLTASMELATIAGQDGALLRIGLLVDDNSTSATAEGVIRNILFADNDANGYKVADISVKLNTVPTAIHNSSVNVETQAPVYTVSGVCISENSVKHKGIYIKNGKKFVVK